MSSRFALIIVGVLTSLLVVLIGIVLYLRNLNLAPPTTPPATDQTLPKPVVKKTALPIGLEPKLVKEGSTVSLQIWLDPAKGPVALSTIALKIDIKGKSPLTSPTSNATISPDFKVSGWSYPFNRVEGKDGALTVSLSAVYATPDPFPLDSKKLLFSIPLTLKSNTSSDLTVTIDPVESKVFDKQNQLYQFTNSGKLIKIK